MLSLEEAYLLGVLFGRGAVEEDSRSDDCILVLRLPFIPENKFGAHIVRSLFERGPLSEKAVRELPRIQTNVVARKNVVQILESLERWRPPISGTYSRKKKRQRQRRKPSIKCIDGKWRIHNKRLATEYLDWQKTYSLRQKEHVEFMMKALSSQARFMAHSESLVEKPYTFGKAMLEVRARVPKFTFDTLKEDYGIDLGEVHRFARIPEAITQSDTEPLKEFVRGFADATGTLNHSDTRAGNHKLWRVQFGILHNDDDAPINNYDKPIRFCGILQEKLGIPVHYIAWGGRYRSGRDTLVMVFVYNLRDFGDIFKNPAKQEEFVEHLQEDSIAIEDAGIPGSLAFCPREGKNKRVVAKKYHKRCKLQGCDRLESIPQPLTSFGQR